MKLMKTNLAIFAFLILCIITGCSVKEVNKENPKHVTLDAKTDYYETIDELEGASDIIVIGIKEKEVKTDVERNNAGEFMLAYTISSFQINEVIKSNQEGELKDILVYENQAFDSDKNEILHIAGYENMIEKNQYILYLRKADEGYYIPLGVTTGKIPLSSSEFNKNAESQGRASDKALHQQIQDKYQEKIK